MSNNYKVNPIKELDTLAPSHDHGYMLLSVACPAGPQHYAKLHLQEMDQYLSFWNLSEEALTQMFGV